jgi:hypothetical protein
MHIQPRLQASGCKPTRKLFVQDHLRQLGLHRGRGQLDERGDVRDLDAGEGLNQPAGSSQEVGTT